MLSVTRHCRFPNQDSTMSALPTIFLSHGSPMLALQDTPARRFLQGLGKSLARPQAIVVVSAHWESNELLVNGNPQPETWHDFGGFPQALHEVQYPAPGHVELAEKVADATGGKVRTDWGLDHGTWCVLRRMFPNADVPVVQLSIDRGKRFDEHLALGRSLAPLRDEGVLVLGSGNIVHNLRDAIGHMRTGDLGTPAWAARFDEATAQAVQEHDLDALVALGSSPDARHAHPSLEHWIPILYAAGASRSDDAVSFPIQGFDWGSLSMRAVRFG